MGPAMQSLVRTLGSSEADWLSSTDLMGRASASSVTVRNAHSIGYVEQRKRTRGPEYEYRLTDEGRRWASRRTGRRFRLTKSFHASSDGVEVTIPAGTVMESEAAQGSGDDLVYALRFEFATVALGVWVRASSV
jgi:hypothetical protein